MAQPSSNAKRRNKNSASIAAPLVVGFIGAGNVLGGYLQSLDRLIPSGEALLGGIVCRNSRRAADLKRRRPDALIFPQLDDTFFARVDIVAIITPPDSHAELALLALSRGKHVLLEKPLALDQGSARALVGFARKSQRHLVAAPFVHLSPTYELLRDTLLGGGLGTIHSARGLYGNVGSHWATWYHQSGGGPLADLGIYNLKSLTGILGPVKSVYNHEARSARIRKIGRSLLSRVDPDVAHTVLTHHSGAVSSLVSSHAITRYERPALEFYGSKGTAYLKGDDWDPRGIDIWYESRGCWESYPAVEPTWLWTDGLIDLVRAIRTGVAPRVDLEHDLHLIDVLAAAAASSRKGCEVPVRTRWVGLSAAPSGKRKARRPHSLHDHTRPSAEQ